MQDGRTFGGERSGWMRGLCRVCLMLCVLVGSLQAAEAPKAYLIRLKGMINEAYAQAIIRKMREADAQGVKTIILELDTGGGTVDASMKLADFIFKDVKARVIAYVNPRAYSGGTMVAIACDEIYIDADIGMMGDVGVILMSGEELGEKFQSPVRKAMGNYADGRGYPVALAEAMVSKNHDVFRIHMKDDPPDHFRYAKDTDVELMREEDRQKIESKDLVVAKGELLTLSAKDAVKYGFARKAVENRAEFLKAVQIDESQVTRMYMTGSELVLTILDAFGPVLFVAGLILLFIEMLHPGFGLPGILGLVLLGTFFVVKVCNQYARLLEILLFVAGVVLLLIEIFFIPGFGVPGIIGIGLLFVSVVLMMQPFDWPHNPYQTEMFLRNIATVIGMFVATAVGLLLLAKYVGSVPVLNRLVTGHTMATATVSTAMTPEEQPITGLVGQVGVAITPLRPTGRAEFGDRQVDVLTEGDFLEKGAVLEVIEVKGRQVVVKVHRGA